MPTVLGDVVAFIKLPNGYVMYQKVGVLLKQDDNDAAKGPGFTVGLDRWFNPAGVPGEGTLFLSVYHPKERADKPPAPRGVNPAVKPKHYTPPDDLDDDIPF